MVFCGLYYGEKNIHTNSCEKSSDARIRYQKQFSTIKIRIVFSTNRIKFHPFCHKPSFLHTINFYPARLAQNLQLNPQTTLLYNKINCIETTDCF